VPLDASDMIFTESELALAQQMLASLFYRMPIYLRTWLYWWGKISLALCDNSIQKQVLSRNNSVTVLESSGLDLCIDS
jgi:hypothetical protein